MMQNCTFMVLITSVVFNAFFVTVQQILADICTFTVLIMNVVCDVHYRALEQCGFLKDGALPPNPDDAQFVLSLPTRHIWEITPDLRTAITEAEKFCQTVGYHLSIKLCHFPLCLYVCLSVSVPLSLSLSLSLSHGSMY